jgi:hypothetical protein
MKHATLRGLVAFTRTTTMSPGCVTILRQSGDRRRARRKPRRRAFPASLYPTGRPRRSHGRPRLGLEIRALGQGSFFVGGRAANEKPRRHPCRRAGAKLLSRADPTLVGP